MASKRKRRKKYPKGIKRRPWTDDEYKALKAHSRKRTPTAKIAKQLKRTPGALRVQAHLLGIPLGHMQRAA